ncbi:MAG: type II toxin-antitoxin system Phd/YefM family antitoxin [Proteobacteria bacterium]|nr:type II toxin-antitoxin system Phd/YefM family antitoxin [Pseudomonadota bacterium]
MRTVSVSNLKENLSRYIRQVRDGSEVQISSHGRPVAKLVGLKGPDSDADRRRRRLVAKGVLRAGSGDASPLLDQPPLELPGVAIAASLDEERGDRV